MKHIIDITLMLTSPLHISTPESDLYASPLEGSFIGPQKKEMFPITRTVRLPIAQPEVGSEDGQKYGRYVPVITGNSLRGRLRRCAANVLFDLLTDRGEKLGLDAYHVAMCGASSGVPDGDPRGLAEAQIVMKHPYVGTFGGGRRFTRSCFEAGISWPIHEVTIASRSVPESVREFASEHQRIGNWDTNFLTYNLFFTRKDDVVTFADGIMGNVSDAETAIAKWLGGLAESRSRKKAAAKASADAVESGAEPEAANKKTGLAGLTASEVVVPGVHFNSRHFYNDVHAGPAGLGLLILAFTRFVNDGQHGGKKSIGFGRFKVRSSTLGGQPLFVESPSNGEYEPNMGNPVVATAMDAWAAYAPTVTAENLTAALLG